MNSKTRISLCQPTYKDIQLYEDTGCNLEDLPRDMDGRDGWWERDIESGNSAPWARLAAAAAADDDDDDDCSANASIELHVFTVFLSTIESPSLIT